jgi:signal transduction histidine kinase
VDVLEEDRLNLSMMLHDDIGQLVIGTKMQIENLKDALAKIDPRVPVRLDPILKSLQEIVSSLRNRSRQLRPSSLDTIGLAAALRSIDAGDNKCRVHCHAQEEPEGINPDLKLTVFRIAQEAVTNALKHAGCREIHLRLGMPKDDTLTLTVEDDGRGFSYDEMASDVKGLGPMGLLIMRERAVNAGGELRVESAPGRGTSVVAAFPVGTRGTVPGEPPLPA